MASVFSRALGVSEVKAAVKEAIQLQRDFPDVVAGFDMVTSHDLADCVYVTSSGRLFLEPMSVFVGRQGGQRQDSLGSQGGALSAG